jgi:hypothetical protein
MGVIVDLLAANFLTQEQQEARHAGVMREFLPASWVWNRFDNRQRPCRDTQEHVGDCRLRNNDTRLAEYGNIHVVEAKHHAQK